MHIICLYMYCLYADPLCLCFCICVSIFLRSTLYARSHLIITIWCVLYCYYSYLHFTSEESEVPGGQVTCPYPRWEFKFSHCVLRSPLSYSLLPFRERTIYLEKSKALRGAEAWIGCVESYRESLPPSRSLLGPNLIRHNEETQLSHLWPGYNCLHCWINDEVESWADVSSAVAEWDKERGRGLGSTFLLSGKLQGLEVEQKANTDRTIS